MRNMLMGCWTVLFAATVFAEEPFLATHAPQFYAGCEFPGATGNIVFANQVVQMHYDFTKGGRYTQASFTFEKPRFVKSVTFTAKRPLENALTIRISDSKGQTFQKSTDHVAGDWQTYRFNTFQWAGHWGGANDGVLRQPITKFAILVENSAPKEYAVGDLLIKDVQVDDLPEAERAVSTTGGQQTARYLVTDFGATDVDAIEEKKFSVNNGGTLNSGILNVDFSKHDVVSLSRSNVILGQPETLILTVEADREAAGADFTCTMAGGGWKHFYRLLGKLPAAKPGERIHHTFSVPAPPDDSWNDKNSTNKLSVSYPLRLLNLSIYRAGAAKKPMSFRLVGLEAVTRKGGNTFATRTRIPYNVNPPDFILANVRNLDSQARDGTFTLVTKNWEGVELAKISTNLVAIPSGRGVTFRLPLPKPTEGTLFLDYDSTFAPSLRQTLGLPEARWNSAWAAPLADAGTTNLMPELPWGMGIFLPRNGFSEEGFKRMETIATAAQSAGIKWSREEYSWGSIEQRRGEFHFENYDRTLAIQRAHGISVYGLVDYWTAWTKPYTEEGCTNFCTYLRALVRHYKGQVHHWEIYNEPNIDFWKGPKELYPVLLKMAYETVKSEDPTAEVMGCSTAGVDTNFVQLCLNAKAPFDVLTIHPYRHLLQEKSYLADLANVRAQVGGRPVWITEVGWPTSPRNVTERQQAGNLARAYLCSSGNGLMRCICEYDFVNDGWNPYYTEENFGVLRSDLSPKPAYRALAKVCRTFLSGKPELQILPISDERKENIYVFRMGGKSAVWVSGQRRLTLTATADAATLSARNLMDEPFALRKENGRWTFDVDNGHMLFFDARLTDVAFVRSVPVEKVEVIEF